MKLWPFKGTRRRAYLPGKGGYSEGWIAGHSLKYSSGDTESTRLSIVDAALGLVSRPFLTAEVTPPVVDGCNLASWIRTAMLCGDVCLEQMIMEGGRIGFRPLDVDKITGPIHNPLAWKYYESESGYVDGSDVIQINWSRDVGSYRGTSILSRSDSYFGRSGTLEAALGFEKAITDESQVPVVRLLLAALELGEAEFKAFSEDLKAGQGAVLPVSVGGDTQARPKREGEITAILRPEPSEATVKLRRDLELGLAAALGIPAAMLRPDASNIDLRESSRQLLANVLKPLARSVADELTLKMGHAVKVSVDHIAGADLATKSRALKGLVEAGMTLEDAKEVVGI